MKLNSYFHTSRFLPVIALMGIVFLGFQQLPMSVVFAQTVNLVDDQAPLLASSSAKGGEESASVSASPLPLPSPENKELTNLREKYKTDLSIYRTDERDFSLAKSQLQKLQTLASLEVAVKATRKVMITRAIVLQDYVQILNLIVKDTSGIDVAEKAALIKQLESANDRLKANQLLSEQAIDRESVQVAALDFAKFGDAVSNLSYKSMSYINYGRLQSVYDKMVVVRDEVTTHVNSEESNGLKLGEKRRALDQISQNLVVTKQSLDQLHTTFLASRSGQEADFEAGAYPRTVQTLSTIYADLYRNLTFLREVVKE